jgi:hypothetical protein
VIKTTREHSVYVLGRDFLPAGELTRGDLLRSHDGQWVAVEEIVDRREVTTVYNLRVAEYHTYFVGAHEWGFSVWAHNACGLFDLYQVKPGQGFDRSKPSAANGKSYITYVFKERGKVVYVGRASGKGTPDQVLAKRIQRGHDHYQAGLKPEVVAAHGSRAASRGAEEFFIQCYREQGAKLRNIDEALSYKNDRRAQKSLYYLDAYFQELFANSGQTPKWWLTQLRGIKP